ncbi:RNA polymerase sigma factor [Sphingobacterium faecale]|uniref:RNA polymerase sigma-70 factor n=1 Tax=Sphingobacterium faecale TaxID=2803775 RepID=A0ABS1R397_9SPHI|nr:RNA polymerase sigma-70 factor [Sphingobacterium faecale]MBL1409186.1 RNA polymerase sigma-70 factor [Sphingobacterium faecale]
MENKLTELNNDKDILYDFRNGKSQALERFIKRHQREMTYFAQTIIGNLEYSEEIIDDCFLKLWNRRKDLPIDVNLKSYLFVMVKNACLDFLRSPKRRQFERIDELTIQIPSADRIENNMIYAELLSHIYKEVNKLPPKQRLVFTLSYFEGLNTKEISEKLKISTNAVFIHKHEATKTIRSLFKGKKDILTLFIILFLQN